MTESAISKSVALMNPALAVQLFGTEDRNLSLIEQAFEVQIFARDEQIEVTGQEADVAQVIDLLTELQVILQSGITIGERDVVTAIKMANSGTLNHFVSLYEEEIGRTFEGKAIRTKTVGQRQYLHAVNKHAITFGIGPAGTGKTFLAVMMAVQALKQGRVKRIVLTRPAVEAGESLGFLPGDLKEKVDPYLRPIYDALYTIYGREHTERLLERGVIEVAPLAYMRGRTLEDAFVILDEAQNTTVAQMKMFLTRLGFGSKMIVNGDKTQIDLPRGAKSGLIDAERHLQGIKDIDFVHFTATDVVRHPVVSAIINAYANEDKGN
ncbi:PhoH-like protein [Aerococcus viridans]|uniref:PhoH-like protein n=2 Tax=Aerococcus viridans TaxID=1377 RepID=A0AAU8U8K1_9LACT|nr:PhoH family protein [Aerococcus viridans]AMC00983.1 phosphate starvation-inducible protein PhoH [Aerococcus viridans]EFG49540.1 PhoH family protein [Aerococcus viridans ATCC 11563 = CCUG 4311]SUU04313.1 PhoH-like protein [Aerococcus viridans]